MSNNPNQEKRMQQQSFNRGRMRGQFSGVKEKPKDLKASIKRLASYVALNKKLREENKQLKRRLMIMEDKVRGLMK